MSEKITAADAIRLLDAHEAAAVDVREPDEFAVGHIPGAKLLPLGQVLSRYQQDYRPTLGRDGKKESGTLEVIKFYYDGAIRFEQHCYGEAATFVFGVWASGMDEDGTLHWVLPDRRKSYYDEAYLPKKLDRVDETGNLYFDGSNFPWKLADDFAEDKRWGYPKWKVVLGKLTGKGKKGD